MDKKRLMLVSEAASAGVGRYVIDIAESIDRDLFEPMVVYSPLRMDGYFQEGLKRLAEKGIEAVGVDMRRSIHPLYDFTSLVQLTGVIARMRPDIIHCNSSKAGALGRMAGRLCGVSKIIYTPHAYAFQDMFMPQILRTFYAAAERVLFPLSHVTVNVSENERLDALIRGVGRMEKMVVVENGIDLGRFSGRKCPADISEIIGGKGPVIGTVSRMCSQKNPMMFLRLVNELCRMDGMERAVFLYVGDGDLMQDIIAEARRLGVYERIAFTGFRTDIEDIIASFDVFVSTSNYEGLPYNILEAMACRVPVVATNVTGNNDILSSGCGVLVGVEDAAAMALEVARLLGDKTRALDMTQRAYFLLKGRFSIEVMIGKIQKIYMGL